MFLFIIEILIIFVDILDEILDFFENDFIF